MGKSIRDLSTVTRVGLDLAKRVFQVHAVDAKGEIVAARKLTHNQLIPFFAALPPCVVAMEAGASAVLLISTCSSRLPPSRVGSKREQIERQSSGTRASAPRVSFRLDRAAHPPTASPTCRWLSTT